MVRPYVFRFWKIYDSRDSPLLSYSLQFGEAHKRFNGFIGEAQPIGGPQGYNISEARASWATIDRAKNK